MKTGILIQTRMGSTRLPGKVMMDLCHIPVVQHIVNRLQRLNTDLPPVIMTSLNPKDNILEAFCQDNNILCFRGSEDNLMERTLGAADYFHLDAFVRLGADAPFTDYKIINTMLDIFHKAVASKRPVDYVSNTMERAFPLGLDAEIMTTDVLRRLIRIAETLPLDEKQSNRENVIPYLHQHLDDFNCISYTENFDYSGLRLTLDTPEDFELTRLIYEALFPQSPDFTMEDILSLLEKHPDWVAINAGVVPQTGYWTDIEKDKLNSGLARGQVYGTLNRKGN